MKAAILKAWGSPLAIETLLSGPFKMTVILP
jgi:hypothetical protein